MPNHANNDQPLAPMQPHQQMRSALDYAACTRHSLFPLLLRGTPTVQAAGKPCREMGRPCSGHGAVAPYVVACAPRWAGWPRTRLPALQGGTAVGAQWDWARAQKAGA